MSTFRMPRQSVHQEPLVSSGFPKHAHPPSKCTLVTNAVYKANTDVPELRGTRGKRRATSRAYAVANAVLRDPPAQVLPAIPRHMLPYVPRSLRESLKLTMDVPSKSKRGPRTRMEAFQHRGTGSSPLALTDEDFETRRQRQQQSESTMQRLAKSKRMLDFKSHCIEHDVEELHAASTRSRASSRMRRPKSIEAVVQDIQDVLSSMRALLWAFFDYQDSQSFVRTDEDSLELLQSIADVLMEADFDDDIRLREGGMSEPENARAVLELTEDMGLTRAQIDQLWEELELQSPRLSF